MRVSLMPIDLAASTKGSSRSASVLARITRATVGISGTMAIQNSPRASCHSRRKTSVKPR